MSTGMMTTKIFATREFRTEFPSEYDEGKFDVLIATLEIHSLGGQAPYFSATASLYDRNRIPGEDSMVNSKRQRRYCGSGGQMHNDIEKHFPELAKYLKWHLTSTKGPMHYIANTVYHVQQGKLDYARSSAVWPDATDEELIAPGLEGRLRDRLKGLMEAFKADMSELFGVRWSGR